MSESRWPANGAMLDGEYPANALGAYDLSCQEAESILSHLAGANSPADLEMRRLIGPLINTEGNDTPEANTRKAEARYRVLVEQIPAITFMAALDDSLNEMYVSPQIEKILGYSQKEWLEDPILWYTRLHPEDRERWHSEFAQTCATGGHFCAEYRFLARDGRVVWVQGEARMVRDDQGRPLFLQGVAFDITERKLAEQALRRTQNELEELVQVRTAELTRAIHDLHTEIAERKQAEAAVRDQEARLRSVVQTAVDAIVVIDERGAIEAFNPAAERLFGCPADEALGRNVSMLMPSPHRDEHDSYLAHYLSGGERKIIGIGREVVGQRMDGSTFPMELAVSEMTLHDGRKFTGMVRDITERKRTETKLRQAQHAAEAANRLKSEFLANMSHEIRTPLNGILGMTELALLTDASPEQRRFMNTVKQSGEQLLHVINDILDFSKIEAGKLEFEFIDFPLRDTLAGLLRTIALRAHEKGLELAYRVPPDVPDGLVGDPVRLRQVIVNLVGNAIKFTAQGEVAVEVRTEAASDEEVRLHFGVRDTGTGIPADKQQSIFQPFTQADGSTTRKYGGTGLGLTISSRLVEAMGGRLQVESAPGQGSTFYFSAKFGRSKAAMTALPQASPVGLRDRRVLIVDDNATNRFILQEFLTGWLLQSTEVDGGAAAITAHADAAASGQPFDLILLDCQMPEMDGYTVAERIRERDDKVTIMMLTSADQSGESARCRALGIVARLVKPISPSELLEAIALAMACDAQLEPRSPSNLSSPLSAGQPALRILLAEDNEVNQLVATEMLKRLGHVVVVATNGKIALELLGAQQFDLVFMDVQMPEMDGLTATAALRAQEESTGCHMPVIAMTAHAMKGDRERCLTGGMDGYVAKPIQPAELRQAITDSLPLIARMQNGEPQGESAPASPPAAAQAVAPSSGKTVNADRPDVAVLDRAALRSRLNNNKQILEKVVGIFLRESPSMLTAVREAVAKGSPAELARAAHTLKGAVGNLGAAAAFEAVRDIEATSHEGDLSGASVALAVLEKELTRCHEALAHWGREGYA